MKTSNGEFAKNQERLKRIGKLTLFIQICTPKLIKSKASKRISARNFRMQQDVALDLNINSTSMTDTGDYENFCQNAIENDEFFKVFRQNEILINVMEHVPAHLGDLYLDLILQSKYKYLLLGILNEDQIGCPVKSYYMRVGTVSPTALRYASIAAQIANFFGALDNFFILEIGAGYGGQAHFISQIFQLSQYTVVDLKGPSRLAKKYLSISSPDLIVRLDDKSYDQGEIDLLISNYAFSELKREEQERYFSRYVSKSSRGYVLYNETTPSDWNSISLEEFLQRIPGSICLPESPETGKNNRLVIWGHNN